MGQRQYANCFEVKPLQLLRFGRVSKGADGSAARPISAASETYDVRLRHLFNHLTSKQSGNVSQARNLLVRKTMRDVVLWCWLALSCASSISVAVHLVRHPPRMWIMGPVWTITALWAGPLGAIAYWKLHGRDKPATPLAAAKAATHCGAGCTLGDIVASVVAVVAPFTIAGYAIFGEWVYGFVAAFLFGIAFQYFTIAPMRHLGLRRGLVAAVKADAFSLAAWQVGMYAWMAIARFAVVGHPFTKSSPVFWVMMQIAMLAGFVTSYPVNVVLLRRGLKEAM